MHVYLLQPSTSAYGGIATSLLGNNGATSADGYTLTKNSSQKTQDPYAPAAAEFVTSDSNGAWNLTGAYSCTVGQPVYVYGYGGTVGPTSTSTTTTYTYTIKSIQVNNAGTGKNGTATYTLTVTSTGTPPALAAGQAVTISGLPSDDDLGGGTEFSIINGAQTVIATPASTTTSFSFTATNYYTDGFFGLSSGNDPDGTYTPTGGKATATVTTSTTNPATLNTSIVALATLGLCPSTGNFSSGSGALSYVYMNEVSTVATAYTFQPFTLATNNDAWHIGTTGGTQALLGIANAANTAGQLYSIQGNGPASTTSDGEGHIANATTTYGNGTVPQSTIDTLANILAACIDSTPGTGGATSSQCTSLFNIATDNGETNGTSPTDTATAAINIARYPDGNYSAGTRNVDTTYASDLYSMSNGTVPYTPQLGAAPNDWTLSISYTGGGLGKTDGESPHDVAVDASGNIYTTNFSGNKLAIFSPLGVPANTDGYGTGLDEPGSVAIDSTSSYVWLVNYGNKNVSRFTTDGGNETQFSTGESELQDAEIDGSGNVWVTADNASSLVKLNSGGTVEDTTTNGGIATPYGIAIQPGAAGNVWVADEGADDASAYTDADKAYNGSPFAGNARNGGRGGGTTDVEDPIGAAIDASGNVWLANHNGTVSVLTNTGGDVTGSPFSTGSTNYNDSIAIDGGNNVWVTNTLGDTVYELTDAGGEITPTTGYAANPSTEPDGIAIDPSGNVWYDSFNAAVLYEVVGAASPTVTPLSYAVTNSHLGAKPQ
jgi:sugar lactone lactonase YvrE